MKPNTYISKPNWHVVYTKPRTEKKVYQKLIEVGFESFLPLQKVVRQWSDRKKKVEVPLFTSYVFINTNAKHYQDILSIFGIVRFIYFCGKPAIVRPVEIENIKEFLNRTKGSKVVFEKNDRVEITEGPLGGKRGKILQVGKNKIKISIEQLGITLVAEVHKATARQLTEK